MTTFQESQGNQTRVNKDREKEIQHYVTKFLKAVAAQKITAQDLRGLITADELAEFACHTEEDELSKVEELSGPYWFNSEGWRNQVKRLQNLNHNDGINSDDQDAIEGLKLIPDRLKS